VEEPGTTQGVFVGHYRYMIVASHLTCRSPVAHYSRSSPAGVKLLRGDLV
jgi:hypothetical protein